MLVLDKRKMSTEYDVIYLAARADLTELQSLQNGFPRPAARLHY